MGAGISDGARRSKIRHILQRVERELKRRGVPCQYARYEVRGDNFVTYMAQIGPASNGEQFGYLVLRFNERSMPVSSKKQAGDVDYTDFHTRDIAEFDRGGYDAGVQAVLNLRAGTAKVEESCD